MLTGLSGSLLSNDYAERVLTTEFGGHLGELSSEGARRALHRWWHTRASQLGPVSSLRSVWDVAAAPVAEHLGFTITHVTNCDGDARRALLMRDAARVGLIAGPWAASLDSLWHQAIGAGIALDAPWSLCTNGHDLRLVDTHRTFSRAFLQFDLQRTIEHLPTFQVFWGVLRAEAFHAGPDGTPLIRQVLHAAHRHGHAVGRSLKFGVVEAVGHLLTGLNSCGRRDATALFDESLTVVYRILFLMFAEARDLVPNWHPLYRDSYTIESLRARIEQPGHVNGLWETLQAIARLVHRGCHAGTLVVPAFNGRLFSPARTPLADSCPLDDEIARKALLGLSTRRVRSTRTRIDYRDLGVEQLGAVYESVLDYEPAVAQSGQGGIQLRRGGDRRKSTGSFYTPQSITDYLVRRTLHPLVSDRPAHRILDLRIVDPAMGSAAFLVSACRYVARAYEQALIREGACRESDINEGDRATFRRLVAQRCLFGVDLNHTAVQLARLSLWLATLSAGKPLTFLDHRLVCGNSLLGASPVDVARQPPGGRNRRLRGLSQTPLFSPEDLEPTLANAVGERRWIAETSDDTPAIVSEKERRLEALRHVMRWNAVADLWCACWMWPDPATAPGVAVFASLSDEIARGRAGLAAPVAASLLQQSREVAHSRRFLHWVLEFPEAYFDENGQPQSNPGFDAVLGNPPWDMLDAGSGELPFFRGAGIYRHQGAGRINRYQLFVERALTLARRGGRIGLVLPSGFATDHTAAPLRRRLLAHSCVDTISGFENRKAIFPIHRSVRFLICTATSGEATSHIACRFGMEDPATLDSIPDTGDRPGTPSHPITLTPALITALTGDTLAIPELRAETDVRILERIVHRVPRLGDASGWHVRFGRELNATDDRVHFQNGRRGLPVLEGKHIEPFQVHVERASARISETVAAGLLDAAATYRRPRLAYRDVASSRNRLSLIAAVLPAGVVTTHSLFCLKSRLPDDNQAFLCGMLNSFVANYLVRLVMTTHLGSSTVESLRVPRPRLDAPRFVEIVELVRAMERGATGHAPARLQALAARCYELTTADFAHVLGTFPLVDEKEREAAMEEFLRTSL